MNFVQVLSQELVSEAEPTSDTDDARYFPSTIRFDVQKSSMFCVTNDSPLSIKALRNMMAL